MSAPKIIRDQRYGVLPACPRCGRGISPWPLKRAAQCSPTDWARCIRNDAEAYGLIAAVSEMFGAEFNPHDEADALGLSIN